MGLRVGNPGYVDEVSTVPWPNASETGGGTGKREQDHHADDRAENPAKIKGVAVANPDPDGEDQIADHRSTEAEHEREQP